MTFQKVVKSAVDLVFVGSFGIFPNLAIFIADGI